MDPWGSAPPTGNPGSALDTFLTTVIETFVIQNLWREIRSAQVSFKNRRSSYLTILRIFLQLLSHLHCPHLSPVDFYKKNWLGLTQECSASTNNKCDLLNFHNFPDLKCEWNKFFSENKLQRAQWPLYHGSMFCVSKLIGSFAYLSKMNYKFHYNSWIVGNLTLKTTFGTMIPTEPKRTGSDSGVQVVKSNSDIP